MGTISGRKLELLGEIQIPIGLEFDEMNLPIERREIDIFEFTKSLQEEMQYGPNRGIKGICSKYLYNGEMFWEGHPDITAIISIIITPWGGLMQVGYSPGNIEGVSTRYFKVGCEHDYEVTYPYRCVRNYRCKKCGYSWELDSSD